MEENSGGNRDPLIAVTRNGVGAAAAGRYNRSVSNAYDELKSFRSYLRWMCVDQSTAKTAVLSWSMFAVFGVAVPCVSHFLLACATCDAKHERPYDSVVQISLTAVSALSFLCLSRFVRKYGLRRFLFFDKLCDESEIVRRGYTDKLNYSLTLLSIFVLPCFLLESAYKIWWYASGASQIPFLGNVILSDVVACLMELCSWLYRTTVIFLVCVLFHLICHLQILRLQDFAQVFQVDSDVGSVLGEHLRIRRHLKIISHRYRFFVLWMLVLVTGSQFASLLSTTKSGAVVDIYRAGELAPSCRRLFILPHTNLSEHNICLPEVAHRRVVLIVVGDVIHLGDNRLSPMWSQRSSRAVVVQNPRSSLFRIPGRRHPKSQLCSMTLVTALLIILRSASKITHKAQAVTSLAAKWHVCATLETFEAGGDETPRTIATHSGSQFPAVDLGGDLDGDEAGDEEDELDNTKFIPAYAYSTISFQKRQALVNYFENNRAGITVYGFTLDRGTLHSILSVELALVLWLLGKTIGIS